MRERGWRDHTACACPQAAHGLLGTQRREQLRSTQRRGWGVTRQGRGDSHFRTWPWLQGRLAETLASGMN